MVKIAAASEIDSGGIEFGDVVFGIVMLVIIIPGAVYVFIHAQGGFSPREVGAFLKWCVPIFALLFTAHLFSRNYREAVMEFLMGAEVAVIAVLCRTVF